ncbi:MAG TPA: LPS export ABC transporter permease LptG [Rhodocyclaceae bacterium]|nr:LPS export ABC transporter permease LptG [Rhodocyclaceae bacterium]
MIVLNRYLRREIVAATLLVLLAFLALFAFFDFLGELEEVGRNGYTLKHALIFVALSIPSRAYEVVPIAALIGTLYALTNLARNSELTVMRTSGVSTTRLLGALMGIGLIFVMTTFALGEFIAPPMERVAQKWRLRTTNSALPQELRTGLWIRDGLLFINVQRALPDARLEGVRIYEFDTQHRLLAINEAANGDYLQDQGWMLRDVVRTRFQPDHTSVERLPQWQWKSELTPDMISVVMVSPERMAIRNLYQEIKHLEENSQRADRYEIAYWKKIIYPFAALVMMGLALPFALGNQRSGNVGGRVLLGVVLGMLFHLLNSLFSNLGVINSWPPLMSATTPSLMFLLLAIVMLRGVERR